MAGVTEDDLEWARAEADRISSGVASRSLGAGSLLSAVEFLRLKAGPRSEFYLRAADAEKRAVTVYAAPVVVNGLRGWADFVDRGLAELPVEAQARVAAATDLMEQVEQLLGDRRVHPAAPVMLAGAALEEMLRSLVDTVGTKPKGKPGINSYANALREAGALTQQDVKNVTSWAGMHNDAAHGDFEQIELPNARLMAQAINLFMQKYGP